MLDGEIGALSWEILKRFVSHGPTPAVWLTKDAIPSGRALFLSEASWSAL